MRIFGFTSLPLNVTCDASLNFVNTDVMLVLDVTGSMARESRTAPRRSSSLRDAVMALYDELAPVQTQLEANGLRLRYGVVPYSSTVNVGALIRAANPAYLADTVAYQSRVANFNEQHTEYVGTPGKPEPPVVQTYGSVDLAVRLRQIWPQRQLLGLHPERDDRRRARPGADLDAVPSRTTSRSGADWGWSGAPDTSRQQPQLPAALCRDRHHLRDRRYHWESSGWTYRAGIGRRQRLQDGQRRSRSATNDNGESPICRHVRPGRDRRRTPTGVEHDVR